MCRCMSCDVMILELVTGVHVDCLVVRCVSCFVCVSGRGVCVCRGVCTFCLFADI